MKKILALTLVGLLLFASIDLCAVYVVVVSTQASTTANNGIDTSAAAINTTGATTGFICLSDYELATVGVVSDAVNGGAGNTWIQSPPTARLDAGNVRASLFYCKNCTVGASHVFFVSDTNSFPSITVLFLSGGHLTAPYDGESAGGTNSVSSTIQPGSRTPSEDNTILVACNAWSSDPAGAQPTISAPFTVQAFKFFDSGIAFGSALSYSIQTTATARNPTLTFSTGTTSGAMAMASFKQSVASSARLGPLLGVGP